MNHRDINLGFTLVEMIVVIVLIGILSAAVALFIRVPVEGYIDSARRAELTDAADTALRRMGRDLRLALPNSVRVTDSGGTIEMLLTRTGGRYRVADNGTGAGDWLDFSLADTSLDYFGPPAAGAGQGILAGDRVVVYNLGIPGADAYAGDNTALISSVAAGSLANENKINFAAKQFPLDSPGHRLQVIEGPVSYVCDTTTGRLMRYWAYSIQTSQPHSAALPGLGGVASARLADGVSACAINYDPGVTARGGIVSMSLTLTQAGESVRLYHEVHVINVP